MPCSCIVDIPAYPQNEEWGPLLWLLLHTLAEKAGKQTNSITRGDEMRAWPLFMKELGAIIPCPYCRDHFQEYLKTTPFQLSTDYFEWRAYIPHYFYTFHESVNARLGKPSFPETDVSKTYSDASKLKPTLARLETIQQRAIKMGGVSLLAWRAWLKQFNMLRAAIC
jgi:hypothetical protein